MYCVFARSTNGMYCMRACMYVYRTGHAGADDDNAWAGGGGEGGI